MATNDLTFATPFCGLCERHMSVLTDFLNVSIPFKMRAAVIYVQDTLFSSYKSVQYVVSTVFSSLTVIWRCSQDKTPELCEGKVELVK